MILVSITSDTGYSEYWIDEEYENYVRTMLNDLPDPMMEKMKNANV